MTRSPCCLKTGLKKGPWSTEEDEILIAHIKNHGHTNWRALPKQAGLLRCGKSCRLRWTNYLNPNIKRGNFTWEEEEKIIVLHRVLGNRWSAIAAELPGRTDNEIKNVWHTRLKKRLPGDAHVKQMRTTISTTSQSNSVVSSLNSDDTEMYITKDEEFVEYCEEYKPEIIDESFWSDDQSSLLTTTSLADETYFHIRFPSHDASFEAESMRNDFSSNYSEDDWEFWCNILVETDGIMTKELPDF